MQRIACKRYVPQMEGRPMTSRRGYYDVALFFPATVTLGRFHELLDSLDDHDINVDYASLEFASDGLYCDAKTSVSEGIEALIKDIGNGDIALDWDTMAEWD